MKYIIIVIIVFLIGFASHLLFLQKPKDEVAFAPPKPLVGNQFSNVKYENYYSLLRDNHACECAGYHKCHCDK